jgi:hypothetical protein
MLLLSLYLLGAAALFGTGLAVWYLQSEGRRLPHAVFAGMHACLAMAGLTVLLVALTAPPRGAAMGVSGFGRVAAGCLILTLLTGMLPLSARLRHRRLPLPSLVIGLHATLAVSGVVILAAYYALIG